MRKTMKSSTLKTIVVKLTGNNIFEINVDSDIFDDPHLEAATQAIEQCKIKKYGIIRPITECWEKKDENNKKKHHFHTNRQIVIGNVHLIEKWAPHFGCFVQMIRF